MPSPGILDDHGTHTAGTIVGRPGQRGAFGMAPEAKLASAMVIEGASCSIAFWAASNGPPKMARRSSVRRSDFRARARHFKPW
ncbi:S8 family serine peptidase [Sphingomonas aerolata]|uniref:S8 family serine peptidase n=1 Tax=Sphingomonas aerolata TaxID=185951 RepID=UPI003A5C64CE